MRERSTWAEAAMSMAEAMARRSRCDGAQVGCLIMDTANRVVATGYNGPPQGFDVSAGETCGSWCERQRARSSIAPAPSYGLACPSVHAEANALMFADRRDYEGGTMYVTGAVCQDCAKLVAQSGVSRVVMRVRATDSHRDPRAVVRFLRGCGVEVETWYDDHSRNTEGDTK